MTIGAELLHQSNNIDASALARRFGLSEAQASQAVSALLPAVLGGVKRAEQTGRLSEVEAYAGAAQQPADNVGDGEAVAARLFGSDEASDQVASHAAAQTGLSQSVMRSILPIVVGMVTQQVARRMGGGMLGGIAGAILGQLAAGQLAGGGGLGGGGSGGGLGDIFGGGPVQPQAAPDAGGSGGMFGGLGGLAQSLDRDGDGNPLNDILGGFGGGQRS